MKPIEFEVDKQVPPEKWTRPGKIEWPHMLTLTFNRHRAFRILEVLVAELADDGEKREDILLTFPGELREDPDD